MIDLEECSEKEIKKEEIKFFYRGTNLSKELIITSVKLKGVKDASENIIKIQNEMIKKKKLSQPSQIKTCGSTFKNFSNKKKSMGINKRNWMSQI